MNQNYQDYGTPIPPYEELPSEQPTKRNTPIIVIVVIVVLLCCCCLVSLGLLGILWNYGDQMLGIEATFPLLFPLA